jgi:hypothetical protein
MGPLSLISEAAKMDILSSRTLNHARTLGLLEELAEERNNEVCSLYLTPGLPFVEVEKAVKSLPVEAEPREKIIETASRSRTGAVIFWGATHKYLVLPPFPIRETIAGDTLNIYPLLSLLRADYKIALLLVRLGSYAIGVCQGEKLIGSKVGTGLVHGRHKKGGSSAHRFERHRDKQIEYFLTRVCQHAREQLEPHLKSLDYLVYGGARTTVRLLQKQCPFVGMLRIEALTPLFDIPEPRQAVLETAVSRIWSSKIYEWREED